MAKTLIVTSRVRELAKNGRQHLCMSIDFTDALTKKVERLIDEAANRATANNRTTLMAKDL